MGECNCRATLINRSVEDVKNIINILPFGVLTCMLNLAERFSSVAVNAMITENCNTVKTELDGILNKRKITVVVEHAVSKINEIFKIFRLNESISFKHIFYSARLLGTYIRL